MPRPVHFEIHADDPERAISFYNDVFDWKFTSFGNMEPAYWGIETGPDSEPGDHVAIAVYPMQRHAFLWDRPNTFDPDRFTEDKIKARDRFVYLPFGAGPRICIGLKFAMMEAVTILATLTRQFRFERDEAHEIVPQMNVTLRPKGGMPVFVSQR